ncbi:MAG: hypothetical protein ACLVGF_06875 [Eubacterium sp.]|uniref:hypothetical protein n=1 Tax=Eubacterium sp. TaxID=142586 RepID=UPI00399B43B1
MVTNGLMVNVKIVNLNCFVIIKKVIVVLNLDKLENRGDSFNPFYKNGPFCIENLNTYIGKHNVNYKLQTTQKEFNGNDLILRCNLGHIFYKTFKNIKNLPQQCPICRKENVKIKPPSKVKKDIYNEIVKEAEKRNLTLLSTKDEFIKDKTYIHLYDGIYYYKSNVSSFLYGNTSAPFGKNNPYTIQNINIYLKNKKDCNVICLSNSYIDRNHELDFKCLDCGLEFKMAWHNAYRNDGWHNGIRCPSCGLHTESLHASILKQVFLHEYPDTVVEEKSCISTITGNILPTDIVNHSLKIAIEIQSQYHDKEYQKQKDEIKKSYWLSQNYHFYSPDIRDYTVLEMVQLFFPNILEILSCSGSQCRPVTTSISDFDCSIIVHFCKSRTYVFSCKSVVLQLTCERLTRRIMCDVTTYSTIYSPTRESLGSMMGRIV